MIGFFHTGCGVFSLMLGTWIFLAEKGTRTHIRLGWFYVVAMALLNGTSLTIYNLTGGFNIFHALAVFSLVMVSIGLIQVRRRGPKWMWRHYQYMTWSYVGLLAATSNEAFVRIPVLKQFGTSVALLATFLIVAGSGAVIFTMQKKVLNRYGSSMKSRDHGLRVP